MRHKRNDTGSAPRPAVDPSPSFAEKASFAEGELGVRRRLHRASDMEHLEGIVKRIITHAKADGDAIAAAWLAATYLFPGEEVEIAFVPRVRPGGPGLNADCLVDISCVHDPKKLIFDHKPPACADRNATCATRLVWEHLLSLGRRVGHLEALVRIVHEGDRSPPGRPSPELATSRSEGFHPVARRSGSALPTVSAS